MVALCWVDNTGITRVKTVPLSRFERAAGWGIGMSPVFDVFVVDDSITTSKHIGGPGGDLRLIPDLDRSPRWPASPAGRSRQLTASRRKAATTQAASARSRARWPTSLPRTA